MNPNRIWVPDIVIANREDKNPIIEDVTQILAAVTYNVRYTSPPGVLGLLFHMKTSENIVLTFSNFSSEQTDFLGFF